MDLRATPNLVHLSASGTEGQLLKLDPARGYRVILMSGEVWITQAGHSEDHVLHAGEELTLETRGMAIVSPLGTADVEVLAPTTTASTVLDLSPEAYERYREEAHRLRAEAMHQTFTAVGAWFRRQLRRWRWRAASA
jgi:hypothetical protein